MRSYDSPSNQRGYREILGLIFLLSLPCSAAASPIGEAQSKAREILEQTMRHGAGFVRIHAAEALLATGNADTVRLEFPPDADLTLLAPAGRIGIWRVQALASATPANRDKWIGLVRQSALDPSASDRLQALETLGKLRVRLGGDELQAVRQLALSSPAAAAVFPWWILYVNDQKEALTKIIETLGAPDPVARLRASYIIKREHVADERTRAALAQAWRAEPADSIAYPYLLCAMASLTEDGGERAALIDHLAGLLSREGASGRYEISLTLMQLGGLDHVPQLAAALASQDPDVRVGAAWAILHLAAKEPKPKAR